MSDFNTHALRRMLQLRQFPLFEHADLDELATVAENLVEATVPVGTIIARAGSRLGGIHLVVDGYIQAQTTGPIWSPRDVYGALEVFANREVAHTAVAATPLHTLQLSAGEIGEVFEDNFGVLRAALRELAARVLTLALAPCPMPCAARSSLGLVERLIVFRQQLPFTGARLQALATLAHASDEISWPGQTMVARAGEPAISAFVIIAGTAVATRGDDVQLLSAGSSIGLLETLAGAPHTATIETTMPVRVLRSSGSAILDVIEDYTDVGLAMLATFAAALLDATQHARTSHAPPLAA